MPETITQVVTKQPPKPLAWFFSKRKVAQSIDDDTERLLSLLGNGKANEKEIDKTLERLEIKITEATKKETATGS